MSFDENVYYLENEDFDNSGNLINMNGKSESVVLIFATYCGYCHTFMPTFAEFAEKMRGTDVAVLCICADVDKDIGGRIRNMVPNFQGFPTVVKFGVGGKLEKVYDGDRSLNSLMDFV